MLNSIPEFIYFKDANERLLGCNQAWAGFHGLKPGELTGKKLSDFLTRNELERSQTYDDQVLAGEPCQHTEWFSAPDSRQILLQNNVYPLKDQQNEVTGVLNVSYDVTKWHELNRKLEHENQNRISSEKELGRQNNLIRTVFNSTPDPLGFIDDKGNFVGGNEPFAKMSGFTSDELLGKHLTEVLSEEQLEQHQLQNRQIFEDGKPIRKGDRIAYYPRERKAFHIDSKADHSQARAPLPPVQRRQPVAQIAFCVGVHQETDGATVHPIDRRGQGLCFVQGL